MSTVQSWICPFHWHKEREKGFAWCVKEGCAIYSTRGECCSFYFLADVANELFLGNEKLDEIARQINVLRAGFGQTGA